MPAIIAVLLAITLIMSLVGWWNRHIAWPAIALVILCGTVMLAAKVGTVGRPALIICAALAVLASAAGGGPLTVAILRMARASTAPLLSEPGHPDPTPPEDLLRGGAWIGVLERIAVTAALIAGWPEGIAVVLAVKGLARYPELRSPGAGASERFIIGTFTSVLWASAPAVIILLLR